MYVKESTVVSATSLVLVASSLTVEQLPPVELPAHDSSDPQEAAQAERERDMMQREQDASGEAVLVADDWLKFRVPLAVLSQLACLRIRLARAFAAKVQRPTAALPADLEAALAAAAAVLAKDGGAAPSAGTGFNAGSSTYQGGGFQGGREGDWNCPRGCGVVLSVLDLPATWFQPATESLKLSEYAWGTHLVFGDIDATSCSFVVVRR